MCEFPCCRSQKLGSGQINTCGSTFHAVNQAHTKFSAGYSVTGVGAVDCARHGFKRPNGVVDLQKGERYVNRLLVTLYLSLTLCFLDTQTWTLLS